MKNCISFCSSLAVNKIKSKYMYAKKTKTNRLIIKKDNLQKKLSARLPCRNRGRFGQSRY